jgi:AraC-like DNA-binding protein
MNRIFYLSNRIAVLFVVLSFALSKIAFSGTDSSSCAKGSHPAATVLSKDSINKRDSLSIDSLLKNMELKKDPVVVTIDTPVKKTGSIFNKVSKSLLDKQQKAAITPSKTKSESIYKKIYVSLPGVAFLRTHFVHLLLLVLLVALILIIFAGKQNRDDRNRFLSSSRLSIMDKEIQRACNFVESNFANSSLSVELICNDLVTGEAFLRAIFEKELGVSLDNYIKQVRVNRLKNFLIKDNLIQIENLVANTGFADEKALRDIFLEITGMELDSFRSSLMTGK